jgi:glycosyltransferase involved in cell wall biosynthesis
MARVLLTTDEPVGADGARIAGLQVRVLEMSRALVRAGHDVVVATVEEAGAVGPVDVWITHPRLVTTLAPVVDARARVVDGYESPFGSFLAHATALLPRIGERAARDYRATMTAMLAAIASADRVLCANETQRVSYLTMLSMLGRIGPHAPSTDVVVCASSGASPDPPARPRDDVPHEPIVLWCGGCYPWFDVETYLAALPAIAAAVPSVRFRFAGLDGVAVDRELPLASRIRTVVAGSPELAARSEMVPWLPYAERGALYAAADVGVCTYGDHLETRLSMRTRVIDMVWGGLPLVVSAGDEMGRVVDAEGLGRVVPAGDPRALADAVVGLLLAPDARQAASARARALALGALSWDRQVEPLSRYCDEVAAGVAAPRAPLADAIAVLNDGQSVELADALHRIAERAGNAWRLARTGGVSPLWKRVWS